MFICDVSSMSNITYAMYINNVQWIYGFKWCLIMLNVIMKGNICVLLKLRVLSVLRIDNMQYIIQRALNVLWVLRVLRMLSVQYPRLPELKAC